MTVTRLLVANRGEIACRIIRTARTMGIATIAVYSDADRRALHVEEADEAVALGGLTPADSYLRSDALVEAAMTAGADAVHPGYGFLAENAGFASACAAAGLTFVGPTPEAIAAMGDKLAAKALMRDAGVPVLDVYELDAVPDGVYPLIVKAAAGGGGKGMHVVHTPDELEEAVQAARRESGAAFGDERVFLERYLDRPRHIEVQILGDTHGQILHLGERECSIQRRHQKVIEEAPSPAVDERLRKELSDAAVAAGRALSYTNAGTVEFILTPDGSFFFLEVNTRLQVEHPVTELAWTVRGEPLDIVRLQLLIARGEPLLFAQEDLEHRAHAIEVRLYAEDPAKGFLPGAGTLEIFEADMAEGIRWDTGVRSGDEISVHYDPLLAKVIAVGASRVECAARLAAALQRSRIQGLTTNRDFLVAALSHEAFIRGDLHTGFIDEHLPPALFSTPPDVAATAIHAAAAALAGGRRRRLAQPVLRTIPPAWRNNPSRPQEVTYLVGQAELAVQYLPSRDGSWIVHVDDEQLVVRIISWPDERGDGALDAEFNGRRLRLHVDEINAVVYVASPLGQCALGVQPRFSDHSAEEVEGELVAPMPGTVVSVPARAGQVVAKGAILVVLEAMKMEHRIAAPYAGTVDAVRVAPGDTVAGAEVLVVLSAEDEPGP